jgi:hypothetical protein
VVAAARGHVMSTKRHANSYQDISRSPRSMGSGRPVRVSNASPLRAPVTAYRTRKARCGDPGTRVTAAGITYPATVLRASRHDRVPPRAGIASDPDEW